MNNRKEKKPNITSACDILAELLRHPPGTATNGSYGYVYPSSGPTFTNTISTSYDQAIVQTLRADIACRHDMVVNPTSRETTYISREEYSRVVSKMEQEKLKAKEIAAARVVAKEAQLAARAAEKAEKLEEQGYGLKWSRKLGKNQ